jgi:hypothetical protein
MEIGNTSDAIIVGDTGSLPREEAGKFRSYITKDMIILCLEEKKDEMGKVYWDMPFVLETAMQKDPNTDEYARANYFRPMVPVSKTMRIYPEEGIQFLCRIEDEKMENAYRASVQQLRMQMSGIVMPNGQAAGAENSIIS